LADSRRRCVVCRCSSPLRELLRCTEVQGAIVLDQVHKGVGRGAYVHSKLECLSRMGEARLWEHALRLQKGSLNGLALRELVVQLQRMVVQRSS
jgi:predicted RNA-binding protein YlxR (DUF448 family)